MEIDSNTESKLEMKIAELERELKEEKKMCTELESKLSKLAHEIVAEFERKERELKEKFVALAKENRDLEHEVNEWKNKHAKLQSGSQPILKFESGEREVKEKLRTNDLRGEREHKGRFVDEGDCGGDCYDDEEVIIQLHQRRKKKSSEVAGRAKKAAEPAIGRQEVADETVQVYRKKAYLKNAYHKRNAVDQNSQRAYTGRIASSKQLAHALKRVETLQCNLKSCNPSFIKPMVRSHVSGCFWLGLPRKFCEKNLPTHVLEMILEDERGVVHKVKYLGGKTGLSGGWRGFALDYNLEIGDALLFELTEPTRFKAGDKRLQDCGEKSYNIRNLKNQPSLRRYTGVVASSEQLPRVVNRAKILQSNLKSCNPSFVKVVVPSNVSTGFWFSFPSDFCKKNFPVQKKFPELILEDEMGSEYKVKYHGYKSGICGGWSGFAMDHKLEVGDALVFELIDPTRFKVYIIKAIPEEPCQDFADRIAGVYTDVTAKQTSKRVKKKR